MTNQSVRILAGTCLLTSCLIAPSVSAANPHFQAVYNNTFELSAGDPATPSVLNKVIEGQGFNTLLGESTVRFEGVIDISSLPFPIEGTTTFTVNDDSGGGHQLFAKTTGVVIPSATENLVKLDYTFTFTHGTGKFSGIKRGTAKVLGAALFLSEAGGTASWSMTGFIQLDERSRLDGASESAKNPDDCGSF